MSEPKTGNSTSAIDRPRRDYLCDAIAAFFTGRIWSLQFGYVLESMTSDEHADTALRELAEYLYSRFVGTHSEGGRQNNPFGHGNIESRHNMALVWAFLKTDAIMLRGAPECWPFSKEQYAEHADLVSRFPPIPDRQTLATFSKQQPSWAMVLWPLILVAILLGGAMICIFLKNAGLIRLR
jgi:hypothetical protein